jgi:hypothetical protein
MSKMKSMQPKCYKKAVRGANNTNKKAFVSGLYKQMGACHESTYFDKDSFTIKHTKTL